MCCEKVCEKNENASTPVKYNSVCVSSLFPMSAFRPFCTDPCKIQCKTLILGSSRCVQCLNYLGRTRSPAKTYRFAYIIQAFWPPEASKNTASDPQGLPRPPWSPADLEKLELRRRNTHFCENLSFCLHNSSFLIEQLNWTVSNQGYSFQKHMRGWSNLTSK